LLNMPQDPGNQCRFLDAGNDPQRAAAMRTGLDVDGEHALEALRSGHWGGGLSASTLPRARRGTI
jgi:hypothetical protein